MGRFKTCVCVVAATASLLGFSLVHFAGLTTNDWSTRDFSAVYAAALLVRDGEPAAMYDLPRLGAVGDRLLAPDHLAIPVEEVGVGVALAVPLTLVSLPLAFTVWSLLQLLLVAAAVAIAIRSAPGRWNRHPLTLVAIGGIALATPALSNLIDVGQWTGINALGIAMAYRAWQRQRYALGGVWLVGTAAIAKPHLAVGLLLFLVGWGNRRAIAGALAAASTVFVAFIAMVGIGGVHAFITEALTLSGVISQRGGASIMALPSMWFDDGTAAYVLGVVAALTTLALCVLVGRSVRHDARLLSIGFATASVLSLLASPHAFLYDDVMLAPAIAWVLIELDLFGRLRYRGLANPWTIVALWLAVPWLQSFLGGIGDELVARVGELFVWSTLLLAATLWSLVPLLRVARADQHRHVAHRVPVLEHQLVRLPDLAEREGL
ncbi:MAG: DUF2029 domain-containing protein [Candidatus Dormibacteraeota bacterium]|nr:DUF2029 domain-containing protein [Candidatus Dormibacteraeota bacterium]